MHKFEVAFLIFSTLLNMRRFIMEDIGKCLYFDNSMISNMPGKHN